MSALLQNARMLRVVLALILGAISGIPLVFLTPPFQAPDEMQHFYRAYELSELRLRAQVQDGAAGDFLPVSLAQLVQASVVEGNDFTYLATPAPFRDTWKHASFALESSKREFIPFQNTGYYSPLPYLPQVLGIEVGRLFGCGPLWLLWLGRLFSCLAALALLGVAVYAMPAAEELIMLIGLLPMVMYLYASVSADASVIMWALVFTALSFSASTRGEWKRWELVTATVAATVVCSLKPVYAPILLAAIVPGLCRPGGIRKVMRTHAVLIGVPLGATIGWFLFTRSAMTTPINGTHPSVQMSLLVHRPIDFLQALVRTLDIARIIAYSIEAVGVFGWLTVLLRPAVVYVLPLVGFALIWIFGSRGRANRDTRQGIWYLALALISAMLIMTAMYVTWTPAGSGTIQGVQGRYFIPILPLAGMGLMELLPARRTARPAWVGLASVAGIILLEIVATDATIIRAFAVF